jgi:hypothetical protein
MSEPTTAEQEEGQRIADAFYQEGYDAAAREISTDMERSKAALTLAIAHRRLAQSLEMDDTRRTMAAIEEAICRVVRKIGITDAK